MLIHMHLEGPLVISHLPALYANNHTHHFHFCLLFELNGNQGLCSLCTLSKRIRLPVVASSSFWTWSVCIHCWQLSTYCRLRRGRHLSRLSTLLKECGHMQRSSPHNLVWVNMFSLQTRRQLGQCPYTSTYDALTSPPGSVLHAKGSAVKLQLICYLLYPVWLSKCAYFLPQKMCILQHNMTFKMWNGSDLVRVMKNKLLVWVRKDKLLGWPITLT